MSLALCLAGVLLLADTRPGAAQSRGPAPLSPQTPVTDLLKQPPRAWVVEAVANEIKAINHEGSYLRYRVRTVDQRGERVRDTVESKDGSVARLISKDGHPLTEEDDKAERDRLSNLLSSPSAFAKHSKDDVESKKLAIDIIRLLPDAMNFSYTPGQPQTGKSREPEIVVDFTPKPGWTPPTTISGGLRGVRGRAWIDARSRYVVRVDGDIFEAVNFGWGMLAHIYPGGKVQIEQRSIEPSQNPASERWVYTRFSDDLRVRAVMVKTITVHSDIEASSYQVLSGAPDYRDAIRLLLNTSPTSH